MDLATAAVAAVVATAFSIDLWLSHRVRPRGHAAAWATAMSFFSLATWALVLGLGAGWNDTSFRVFYFFGGIANIPLLALGSVYLTAGARPGAWVRNLVIAVLAAGAWVTMTAVPLTPIEDVGIPEGSEVFDMPINEVEGGLSLPSPRVFAALAGGLGTVTIVLLAAWSARRTWRANRRVAYGNLLIVGGTLAPATGGSLTALGETGGFALSLLIGAVLLWLGYRVATSRRRTIKPAAGAGPTGR